MPGRALIPLRSSLCWIFSLQALQTGQQVAKIKAEERGEQEGSDRDNSPSLGRLEKKRLNDNKAEISDHQPCCQHPAGEHPVWAGGTPGAKMSSAAAATGIFWGYFGWQEESVCECTEMCSINALPPLPSSHVNPACQGEQKLGFNTSKVMGLPKTIHSRLETETGLWVGCGMGLRQNPPKCWLGARQKSSKRSLCFKKQKFCKSQSTVFLGIWGK